MFRCVEHSKPAMKKDRNRGVWEVTLVSVGGEAVLGPGQKRAGGERLPAS
jgi:hypothetical protein